MAETLKPCSRGTSASETRQEFFPFWQSQKNGVFKVDTDGDFKDGKGNFGVIIRDSSRLSLATCFGSVFVSSALQAKTFVVKQGVVLASLVILAKLAGTERCVTETDCQTRSGEDSDFSADISLLVKDIFFAIVGLDFSLNFINRNCNNTAHKLAQRGFVDRGLFPFDCPDWINLEQTNPI
uniref:RNase H type-1 domain-containing protein n=1 Tax=Nelumbo nucifera TaxID=4432 RepID=A0A822YVE5_NELNU|nr:TPA_asm: hypothetical protein HUJ06_012069 [Nelumbo nucifera]